MAHIIIGIHGLGNKPDKETITQWWKKSLEEGLQRAGYKVKLPHFEMVYWADIQNPRPLDKTIDDPDNPLFVEEKYTPAWENYKSGNHKSRKKILRFLGKQLYRIFLNEDFTLRYSFIPDFIIRKYFKELDIYYMEECETSNEKLCGQTHLIKQRLVEAIEKHKNDQIMLIAHSMGSIVAFDVLSFVTPGTKIHTFITMGSPLGLPLVVSKIAAQYKNNPNGKKEMVTPPGIYGNWFNFSDILDKITLNYKLSRRYKFNQHAIRPRDFGVVNDYHNDNGEHNPHKSFGYLRSKELARMLNNFMLSE